VFSYVFMKILEKRPNRYDRGINIASWGHASKIREFIVAHYVRNGIAMLDIGCGTGTLLVEAARAGATVAGIDISRGMLAIARKKVARRSLDGRVTLYEAGVVEMDTLFKTGDFDLVTSTFVMSELYTAERRWALKQIHALLKPGGTFVVAAEVLPKNALKRFLYRLVRVPLSFLTYLIAQTGTKPVADLDPALTGAGFHIVEKRFSFLDSFAVIVARKGRDHTAAAQDFKTLTPAGDFSSLKTIWDFVGRWFPCPVEPGLRIIGKPNRDSPVLVTANFHLTVRRVEKSLAGLSCYLLVAPTGGINVWCGSVGGEMTEHSVISAVRTSGIADMVDHRRVILPPLCASGVDVKSVRAQTGWGILFGPVYAKDIPAFLQTGKQDAPNTAARFSLPFRLEMLFSMNFLVWLAVALAFLVFNSTAALLFSAVFWASALLLYAAYPLIPGRSGWFKSLLMAAVVSAVIVLGRSHVSHSAGWIVVTVCVNLWLGFDLRGIVSGDTSEAVLLLNKLHIRSFGKLHKASQKESQSVRLNYDRCTVCGLCVRLCPVNALSEKDIHIKLEQRKCMKCGACVKQCPADALRFE
jgi:ubiquinone/menaquinone biosynthesis C-methylase UbiE/NAD-dependent dihydropyrimidine dehydrogenase PreA subunit